MCTTLYNAFQELKEYGINLEVNFAVSSPSHLTQAAHIPSSTNESSYTNVNHTTPNPYSTWYRPNSYPASKTTP
jgi:hypothetical protein